jgi:predicted  nucleic acid-binding Zn-ribbon protein
MTDAIMMQLAKLQTKVRNLEEDNKRYSKKLIERDYEIEALKKKIADHELKENMIAKNKSYLELKVQKDIDQIKENKKKIKEGNKDEVTTTNNRRKK